MRAALLFLTALACTGEKPEDTAETDTDADTDADTDTDTDTDADTFTVVPLDPTPFGGARLGLYALTADFTRVTSEAPVHVAVLGGEGTFPVTYTPTELEEAPYAPGMFVASYALLASIPDAETDVLLGVSRHDALYVEGTIPDAYAGIGIVPGWNAISARGEGDPPELVAIDAIPLEDNLVLRDAATVGGTWTTTGAYVAVVADIGDPVALVEGAATDPWTLTVSEAPPATSLRTENGVTFGGYRPTAFDDTDASGAWSDGDTVTGLATTAAGEPAWLLWGEPVHTAEGAHTLVTLGGFRVGWSVASQREIAFPIEPAVVTDLVMAAP
ncbi:MAG: hypothetical protein ACK4YP_04585 [Myxococcota bacterium]